MEKAIQYSRKAIDMVEVIVYFALSITLGTIKDILGIIGLALTIAYTIWKWNKESKETKKSKNGK